jgi:hypothetical protein
MQGDKYSRGQACKILLALCSSIKGFPSFAILYNTVQPCHTPYIEAKLHLCELRCTLLSYIAPSVSGYSQADQISLKFLSYSGATNVYCRRLNKYTTMYRLD